MEAFFHGFSKPLSVASGDFAQVCIFRAYSERSFKDISPVICLKKINDPHGFANAQHVLGLIYPT
ncbi:MAG: hypothetical protein FJY21_11940 [Bacteroidetes bacterium]|nr:hypothetical protein [Bacteroidota bacterium]